MSVMSTEQLTKSFGGVKAVKELDIIIREGACTALLGPNGAGKTTTLNMLAGLSKPTSGKVRFLGKDGGDHRGHIGYLPQYPTFYGWMSGIEYVSYLGELSGLPKKDAVRKGEELLSLVGLEKDMKKKTAGYSGGMKQRLGIAQALIHDPKLVILDEPVSALDPHGRREVLELMREMKKKTTILFSTHVLHDAEEISDDIYIMKEGKVIAEGSLVELQKKYQQPAVHIETEKNLNEWSENLLTAEWIRNAEIKEKAVTLTVSDLHQARVAILNDPAFHLLQPVRFEIVKTSLEDLFMQVTKS
ncbi:ABC transporter ATP-binding protein [Bacillus sp. H-16]|uniref:ABC transporter ATP-binding protein n=1 Tax=Alteribacter salitolerans TaxID=2912333 RepID=UPI001964A3D2|nr:ABC transporter ATP-binding protein [Alteribacter salitolerans]MBM7096259.1 ABC transporter ATP-binding protein [Alteribacter salitolerans]